MSQRPAVPVGLLGEIIEHAGQALKREGDAQGEPEAYEALLRNFADLVKIFLPDIGDKIVDRLINHGVKRIAKRLSEGENLGKDSL